MVLDFRNIVVLFSGGMDSTVALYCALHRALAQGGVVHAITFNYGQRHVNEIDAAKNIIHHVTHDPIYRDVFGRFIIHAMRMPWTRGSILGGSKVTKYKNLEQAENEGDEDDAFIPYRNLLFLTVAAQYAVMLEAPTISTGLRGGWPDCTVEFENATRRLLNQINPSFHLRIDTPTHQPREETLIMAKHIPGCMPALELTMTCFEGTRPPCGHCLPCLKRAEGFRAIDVKDPVYRGS